MTKHPMTSNSIPSETELLYSGFIRSSVSHRISIPTDVLSVLEKFYAVFDQWHSQTLDSGLIIAGDSPERRNTLKCVAPCHKLMNYAFGERLIYIDPNQCRSMYRTIKWKLKLRSRSRGSHICMGIGLINRLDMAQVSHRNFDIISSNHADKLNAKKTGYQKLIGYQCGTFNQYTDTQENQFQSLAEFGLVFIRKRWRINGHCLSEVPVPVVKENATSCVPQRTFSFDNLPDWTQRYNTRVESPKGGLSNKSCCFMSGDKIEVSLDMRRTRQIMAGTLSTFCRQTFWVKVKCSFPL